MICQLFVKNKSRKRTCSTFVTSLLTYFIYGDCVYDRKQVNERKKNTVYTQMNRKRKFSIYGEVKRQ